MEQKGADRLWVCLPLNIKGRSQPSERQAWLRWAEAWSGLRCWKGACVWHGSPDTLCLSQLCPGPAPQSPFWVFLLHQRSTQAAATREGSSWGTGREASCSSTARTLVRPHSQPTSSSLGSQRQTWALPGALYFLLIPHQCPKDDLACGPQAEAHSQLLP